MKKVLITSICTLALTCLIGCSNSDSPTGPGLQADITQGTLQEHPNLQNQTLTSSDMDNFFESCFGNSFSLEDLLETYDLSGLQKGLAKKSAVVSRDTTVFIDTTINGTSGSVSISATMKCKASGTDDDLTNISISLQNATIVFNNFSMNDSIYFAGQIVSTANFSMSEKSISGSMKAKAGIRFNGLYKGQFTMDLSAGISGNPNSTSDPVITGNLSMEVTSNGSSFTYSQDLSDLENSLAKKSVK